jgi:hypothetical protein
MAWPRIGTLYTPWPKKTPRRHLMTAQGSARAPRIPPSTASSSLGIIKKASVPRQGETLTVRRPLLSKHGGRNRFPLHRWKGPSPSLRPESHGQDAFRLGGSERVAASISRRSAMYNRIKYSQNGAAGQKGAGENGIPRRAPSSGPHGSSAYVIRSASRPTRPLYPPARPTTGWRDLLSPGPGR